MSTELRSDSGWLVGTITTRSSSKSISLSKFELGDRQVQDCDFEMAVVDPRKQRVGARLLDHQANLRMASVQTLVEQGRQPATRCADHTEFDLAHHFPRWAANSAVTAFSSP